MVEQELVKKAKAGLLVEKEEKEAPPKGENLRTFNVFVGDDYFEVGVDEVGESPVISYLQQMPAPMPAAAPMQFAPAAPVAPAAPTPSKPSAPAAPAPAKEAAPAPAAEAAVDGTPLPAPMPGMIVKYEKQVGDAVSEGETVVVLEAMKMENALPAPASGTIKAINFSSGDSVKKNDVLCVIG
jgi:oxaloacetate decarboxylase alpha subunit/pyruvate carboxylase subunit B